MTETVRYELRDGVALLLIDRPPVNAIDVAVRAGLIAGVARAEADAAAKAVLIACAGRTFLSGADLSELNGPIAAPGYYEALARIEACAKPVVAVLHGTAL
ncbi:MAG TPA: enoyl-CoA hydratase-related protein, partial [Caulobacterales bacterium]|nr:enoyl-CoA hydratase-related protein [Caulobacterales bacterium]